MNSKYVVQLLYCLLHMMAWIRSQPINNTEVHSIFHGSQLPVEQKRESLEKIYTEGGSVSTVANENTEKNVTKHKLTLEDQDLPLPAFESTSKIKPRKEAVIPNKIVPRKGALLIAVSPAPVYEVPTTNVSTSLEANSATSSVSSTMSSTADRPVAPLTHVNEIVTPSSPHDNTSIPPPVVHKPKVTLVPSDSDEFLKSLKNDRNVVIPVLALVLVPLVVLLALFIYKRVQDSRGTYYTQVDFLVDEMYND